MSKEPDEGRHASEVPPDRASRARHAFWRQRSREVLALAVSSVVLFALCLTVYLAHHAVRDVAAATGRLQGGGWSVAPTGVVHGYGGAPVYGAPPRSAKKSPIVAMAATPDGHGYWLVPADGDVLHFGDAGFYGSPSAHQLTKPIVAMAATPDGHGYWLVSADGEVLHFGDATFLGSASTISDQMVSSIVAAFGGYEVVAQDGTWLNFHRSTLAPRVLVQGRHVSMGRSTLRLLGVDASGTEDACTSSNDVSWIPLSRTEASSIAAWHVNAVRVPLNEDCWLGVNGLPRDFGRSAYRRAIVQWVDAINDAGMVAILDLHWSAPASIAADEQWPMADADHSLDFWYQVAGTFADDPSVMFDLFNEPSLGGQHPTSRDWACLLSGCITSFEGISYRAAGMQQLLDVVRSAGAVQPVIVDSLNWSGDPCGIYDSPTAASKCQAIVYMPNDPERQLAIGFHTYNWTLCNHLSCWDKSVLVAAQSVPVVTTELGEDNCSATYIDDYTSWADSHKLSYLAWSWNPPVNGETCSQANMSLISGPEGHPSTVAPAGAAFEAHLAYLSREEQPHK